MTILITGSAGQLGSELQRILNQNRSELGLIPAIYENTRITAVDLDSLDIADSTAVRRFVSDVRPDLILNCAAMTNVDGCESDTESAMRANALGPRNLAIAAHAIGAKLLHVSTDYVFAGDGKMPYCEWDEPAPTGVYGKSKLLGEQYISAHCPRSFVVRTAWLYGYVGKNFVKTIISAAKHDGKLKVVRDQVGCPTNAADLAHHILKIAASEEYGIYHCVGQGACSWHDFACKIVEYAHIPCEVTPCTTEEFPRPAKRPAYSVLDNLMLRCTVGDEMRPWEEALKYYIEHREEL